MANTGDTIHAPDEFIQRLEAIKTVGNKHFKEKDYHHAIEEYSKGVELYEHHDNHTTITNEAKRVAGAICNNRALCHFKLELFGAAIEDSTMAIKLKFWKGFYRRGCSHSAMGKWAKAKKDFSKAQKYFPKSKEIKRMLKEATEANRYQKFVKAIATEQGAPASEQITMDRYPVPGDSYTGPRFDHIDDIDEAWVLELQQFQKDGGILNIRYVVGIMQKSLEIFQKYKNVVYYDLEAPKDVDTPMANNEETNGNTSEDDMREEEKSSYSLAPNDRIADHITVCGDIHGQYWDYLNIFQLNGTPSKSNPYLFNGDFVDRGSWSIEVILSMLAWKCVLRDHFMMTRGNHESINMNVMYGFKGEVEHKYDKTLFDLFTEIFNYLPLAYVLGRKVFVCHGGLFKQDNVKISDLQALDRACQPSEGNTNPEKQAEIMSDLLWSDPQQSSGRAPSKRGGGIMFGPDVTKTFLRQNNLELLIRSHEVQEEGYSIQHDGKLITIFSAPNYVDSMGNKAAYIILDRDYKPSFKQFQAVKHPDVKPMAYAQGPLSFMNFM